MRRSLGWNLQLATGYGLIRGGPGGDGAFGGREEVERCEILLPRDVRGDDLILTFPTQWSAHGFLRRLATDDGRVQALRGSLSELESSSACWRMSDGEVLDQLAWRLFSRRVLIAVRLVRRRGGSGSDETSTVTPDTPLPSERRASPPARRPAAEAPVPVERDPLQEAPGCDCMKKGSLLGSPLILIDTP